MTTSGTPSRAIFDRMRVPELVRRESAAYASRLRGSSQVLPRGGLLPMATSRRTVDDAQQLPDRQRRPDLEPRSELLPAPAVHPTSRRRPPLPLRTTTAPQPGSRSVSARASASPIRNPARQRITISARSRAPSARSSAARITATISSIVGGQPGTAGLYSSAAVPGGSPAWWLAISDARPRLTERISSRPPQDVETRSVDRGRQATPVTTLTPSTCAAWRPSGGDKHLARDRHADSCLCVRAGLG